MERDDHLRAAREGVHAAERGDPRGPARHLRRARVGAALEYLTSLGITAVELLPVHQIADESYLVDRGLSNYWGYSSIGYFAPHALYSATGTNGAQLAEFKGMVKALHRAGIEVILDVVYNHTAEGNHLGPMLSFRGIDNPSYYRLVPDSPRFYMDYTGTGNSLNPVHPSTLRLIMDSLRYFVRECHVDGFRFDLAAALARELHEVDRLSAFFDIIHQDPILSQVKLIAEPWDVGDGGYQVGNFPILWTEWNGLYRDLLRDFWRGEATAGEFAYRFTGSADLYERDGRRPSRRSTSSPRTTASRSTTSSPTTRSTTTRTSRTTATAPTTTAAGTAGSRGRPTTPRSTRFATRQKRNFIATLLLSQGVPMLLAGDERSRTQHGNNNGYCQDNELSWIDWRLDEPRRPCSSSRGGLIALRREHPVFRRTTFSRRDGSALPDVWWFRPGRPQDDATGLGGGGRLAARRLPERRRAAPADPPGKPVRDDSFIVLFNAEYEPVEFTLPPRRFGTRWLLELSTADPAAAAAEPAARATIAIEGRSLIVLRRRT